MQVLVTGATGYIGGRLVPELLADGHDVRILVRDPERVQGRPWLDQVDVVQGDLLDPGSLADAFDGIEAAYYLVHSMHAGPDFAERDRQAARNVVQAAGSLEHCVYLGGLTPDDESISKHLSSRAEVGEILREGLPTTEFRAGPIIGSGSGSFEMVRYLTERLPVMVAPRWIDNTVQPIGIRDVISYLVAALEAGPSGTVEIGAADQPTFREMMEGYAEVRGLRRTIVSVPVLTPRLAGLWVGLVTPIPNRLAVPLIEGIIEDLAADTGKAERTFPGIEPMAYREAVALALRRVEEGRIDTRWSGALTQGHGYELVDEEGLIQEVRARRVEARPDQVFDTFVTLGGQRGWPAWGWAWRLRGLIDRLLGGPGLSRGRRDPQVLWPGEAVDFWRVEAVERPHLLRLRAEMKVPGRAWLQWEVEEDDEGTRLVQTALFAPKGLAGTLYWYLLYPIHRVIFDALVDAVAEEAAAGGPELGG